MRRFELHLHVDEKKGTLAGAAAEGVAFWNGKVCICWKTDWSSMAQYDSIAHLLNEHGHSQAIRLVWVDSAAEPLKAKGTPGEPEVP